MKNGFLKEPPMGWNSWDCYGAAVNEEQLLKNAEYMRDNLKEYGWEYVVCDIQWSEPTAESHCYHNFAELCTDEFSRLIPAENRFPSSAGGKGFKPIADKIHAMGLKFGIHIMRGIPRQAVHRNTPIKCEGVTARDIAQQYSVCPWNTDMYGIDSEKKGAQEYYNSIFELYAQWGVDYIKCDDIANTEFKPDEPYSAREEIEMISSALQNCGRKMVLSLSPGPAPTSEFDHLSQWSDMWRMSGDFWDEWDKIIEMFDLCRDWSQYKQGNSYPDCDMLPVGRLCLCRDTEGRWTRLTENEQITMMTLWGIFGSPLMIGGEMTLFDEFTLKLLTNKDIIEMNKKTRRMREIFRDTNRIIWEATGDNCSYVALFNISGEEDVTRLNLSADKVCAKNLWTGQTEDLIAGTLSIVTKPHCAAVYKVI